MRAVVQAIMAIAGAAGLVAGTAAADEVVVITPYLAQPGTQFYVEGFEARAGGSGSRSTSSTRRATSRR